MKRRKYYATYDARMYDVDYFFESTVHFGNPYIRWKIPLGGI